MANNEPESAAIESHAVTAVHVTDEDKEYVDVAIAAPEGVKSITTTAHHPFYEASVHLWIDADQLEVGDQLRMPSNERVAVAGGTSLR